jgi:hypothetical protein
MLSQSDQFYSRLRSGSPLPSGMDKSNTVVQNAHQGPTYALLRNEWFGQKEAVATRHKRVGAANGYFEFLGENMPRWDTKQ